MKSIWRTVTAHMEPAVFFGSAFMVVGFVVVGAVWTDVARGAFAASQRFVSGAFGWWYMALGTSLLAMGAILAIGPWRRIRIGGPDAKPEFGRASWMAMLFAAGMGTGLVFWSVAEPLTHFAEPRDGIDPRTAEAAREAMRITFFHWGLNAWAIYLVLGLAVAFFHFNRGLPLAPRSVFHPLIGERIHGPFGHGVDILCTVGTLLGVATTLGLGAMQLNLGLGEFFPVPQGPQTQIVLIAVITVIATISVVLGVEAGIRRLSLFNIAVAAVLLAFVFLAGPTQYILETFVSTTGLYLQQLPRSSLFVDFAGDEEWQATWTFFYWGWWISWSPFVAIFIARISCGRTIGEFVLTVLVVPTFATFAWLATFGGGALEAEMRGGSQLAARVTDKPAAGLYALLEAMPLAGATMIFATFVIVLFFVTSSDSGSLVDDMVTAGGDPDPPRAQRVFWAVSEGAVAATLLLVGGLSAIRNAAITLGLPMSLVLAVSAIGLLRALRREVRDDESGRATA